MPQRADQILSVAEVQAAEQALVDAGTSVDALMQVAGRGAAEWVWRIAAGRPVTVLCGPGNNGGDGYVIAEVLRERGLAVRVVAAIPPRTPAALKAATLYRGEVLGPDDAPPAGEVLVDCLFGSGLVRALAQPQAALLGALAASHRHRIAIDVPSGVESDSGLALNPGLPAYDLTVALGAWKFAHVLMPASAAMGALRLVGIGLAPVEGAARMLARPSFTAPPADAHKYRRGFLGVVGGEMPGAAILAATAAQGAGAGYVKLLAPHAHAFPPADLVTDRGFLSEALGDGRLAALLVGPGLGRHADARERLAECLASPIPAVLDADALVLLGARLLAEREAPVISTPHEGELIALERAFDCEGFGSKVDRARDLARVSGMVIVAKGPDTVIAAPDGRMICAPRATSWLSTAGTGDVLAGAIASRLAAGADPFAAACEGVWLHGEAALGCTAPFTAGQLAEAIAPAYAAALA